MRKNNQAVRHFSALTGYECHDIMVRNIQNYLIQKHGWKPLVEHYVLFEPETYRYKGCARSFSLKQMQGHLVTHPDIFIENLRRVIEIDGGVHGPDSSNSGKRAEIYERAKFDVVVLDTEYIKTFKKNIYRELESKILMFDIALM